MDNSLLDDNIIMDQLKDICGQLKRHQRFFPHTPMWWDRCCKRRITRFLKWAQAERSREHRAMVNFCYTCIYEVLQQAAPDDTILPTLNRLKAKLVHLQSVRLQKLLIDNNDSDRLEREEPTHYNVFQMQKRREERTIYGLRDKDGILQTTPRGIAQILTTYFRERYDRLLVENGSIQKLMGIAQTHRATYTADMEKPFDQEENLRAIRAGGRRKAPGMDGLVREFYARTWTIIRDDMNDIFNQMFWDGKITPNQKHGVIICLPKVRGGNTPSISAHNAP